MILTPVGGGAALAAAPAVVALAVTGLTALITTWPATRPAPVSPLGARE